MGGGRGSHTHYGAWTCPEEHCTQHNHAHTHITPPHSPPGGGRHSGLYTDSRAAGKASGPRPGLWQPHRPRHLCAAAITGAGGNHPERVYRGGVSGKGVLFSCVFFSVLFFCTAATRGINAPCLACYAMRQLRWVHLHVLTHPLPQTKNRRLLTAPAPPLITYACPPACSARLPAWLSSSRHWRW